MVGGTYGVFQMPHAIGSSLLLLATLASLANQIENEQHKLFSLRAPSYRSVYSQNSEGGVTKRGRASEKCRKKAGRFAHLKLGRLVSEASGTHH